MKTHFCKQSVALANSFDPDQTRAASGNFSAALVDASEAAFKASHKAHRKNTKEAHTKAGDKHREAVKRATAEGKPELATMHAAIAKGHYDRAAGAMSEATIGDFSPANIPDTGGSGSVDTSAEKLPTPICNEEDPIKMALGNTAAISDDGWALIAPFGEHPNSYFYREAGEIKEKKFLQVLDNESADTVLSKENSLFGRLKRAIIGVPVFKGHGDKQDVDPKALCNDAKIKLGVIDQIRKSARGLEAHFALDNDGAAAVADGYKLPSVYWWVLPLANQQSPAGGPQRVAPFKLISVALTRRPNISGVESLANARTSVTLESSAEEKPNDTTDMKLIAGWLMAQGIALANAEAPTESQILEAIQKLQNNHTSAATALGNDKTQLAGQKTALENEKTTLTTRVTELTTALSNEQAAVKTERKAAATMAVDLAIQRGRKTVADRDAAITALTNSKDFDADSKALLDGKVIVKIAGQDVESGKALANDDAAALANEYQAEFTKHLAITGQDAIKAHNMVMKMPQFQGLAEKLKTKPPGSAAGIGYAH